jgi:hypothetical protein
MHIAATCTSLGGLVYARLVLLPAIASLPEREQGPFLQRVIRRYSYIKWGGVAVVAVTGILSWLRNYPTVENRPMYLRAFAIKMIGAFGLFSITAQLAVPVPAFKGMQRRRGFWSLVNIVCGATILLGAAKMRFVREGDNSHHTQ